MTEGPICKTSQQNLENIWCTVTCNYMDQLTVISEEIVQSTKKTSNRIQKLSPFDIGNVDTTFYYFLRMTENSLVIR